MFTYDQTLAALHDVVDADPNRRNNVCAYAWSDDGAKPECVIGHVLARLDLLPEFQNEGGLFDDPHPQDELARRTWLHFEEHFTPPAVQLLADVQGYADGKLGMFRGFGDPDEPYNTWGDALTMGHNRYMERLLGDEA